MKTDSDNHKDQVTEEQQFSDETKPKLLKISEDELKLILENHEKWLESKGKDGKEANFTNVNLRGINLENANLQKVLFGNSDLKKAKQAM